MLANRVRELTLTVGTGDITLGGALPAHIRFSDAFSIGDVVTYVIEDGDNYEIGSGTLFTADVLQRTTVTETLVDGVYDKVSPLPVSLSGNARVFCTVTSGFLLDPVQEADVIQEQTPGAGVTIDGVLLQDGGGVFTGSVLANGGVFRNGLFDIVAGADDAAATITNLTNKTMRIGTPHYTTSEDHISVINASSQASTSILNVGGGSTAANAVTAMNFYTAANNTTANGTLALSIDGNQDATFAGDLNFGNTPMFGSNDGAFTLQASSADRNSLITMVPTGTNNVSTLRMHGQSSEALGTRLDIQQQGANTFIVNQSIGAGDNGFIDFNFDGVSALRVNQLSSVFAGTVSVSQASEPPLVLNRDAAGSGIGIALLRQANTTDGNAFRIQYQSDTTGVGAASNVDFASIEFGADIHDQATRQGSFKVLLAEGGVGFSEQLVITPDAATFAKDMTVHGSVNMNGDWFNVGGGYGATGVTLKGDTGNILANGTLTVDGVAIFNGDIGVGGVTPAFSSGGGLHINHPTIARMHLTTDITGVTGSDGFDIGIGADSGVYFSQRENANMSFFVNGVHALVFNPTNSSAAFAGDILVENTFPRILLKDSDQSTGTETIVEGSSGNLLLDIDRLNTGGNFFEIRKRGATAFTINVNNDATFAGEVILPADRVKSDFGFSAVSTDGGPVFSGGSSTSLGANIQMFGENHLSSANDMNFRAGTASWLYWDNSLGVATLAGSIDASGSLAIDTNSGAYAGASQVDTGTALTIGAVNGIVTDGQAYAALTWASTSSAVTRGAAIAPVRQGADSNVTGLNFYVHGSIVAADPLDLAMTLNADSSATFAGNISSGSHTVDDHLSVVGAGNARITIGNTSGPATGSVLNLNAWDGSSVIAGARVVGLLTGGGAMRFDTGASLNTALTLNADTSATFGGDVVASAYTAVGPVAGSTGPVTFMDVSAGVHRVGAYDWTTATWKNLSLANDVLNLNPINQSAKFAGDVGVPTLTATDGVVVDSTAGVVRLESRSSSATGIAGLLVQNASQRYDFQVQGSDDNQILLFDNTASQILYEAKAGALGYQRFRTNGAVRLSIDSNGDANFAGDVTLPTLQLSGNASQIALSDPALTQMDFDFPASVGVDKTFRFGRVTDLGGSELNFILYDGAGTGTPGITLKGSGNGIFQGDITANGGVFRNGSFDIVAGADDAAATVSNLTNKTMRFAIPHYLTAEEHVSAINASSQASTSVLNIGGGSSAANAVTEINFYTAANNITPHGTLALSIDGSRNATFWGNIKGVNLFQTVSDNTFIVSGDIDSGVGADLVLYGSIHATLANDTRFRANGVDWLHWDDSAGFATFDASATGATPSLLVNNTATGTAAVRINSALNSNPALELYEADSLRASVFYDALDGSLNLFESGASQLKFKSGAATIAGDLNVEGFVLRYNGDIIALDDVGAPVIGGGNGVTAGANIKLFAGAHATQANDMHLRAGATPWLAWDNAAGTATLDGNVVVAGDIIRNTSVGSIAISGSPGRTVGGNAVFFGADHATDPNGIQFRSGSTNRLRWVNNNSRWSFEGNSIEGLGSSMFRDIDTDGLSISGGNAGTVGANVLLFGSSHVSQANNILFRSGTDVRLEWDDSLSRWDFRGKKVINIDQFHTGTGTIPNYYGHRFNDTFTSGGDDTVLAGVAFSQQLTGAVGDTSWLAQVAMGSLIGGTITTQGTTETINLVASMVVGEPGITVGTGDTINRAASLYVQGAPTEATNNYSLLVDAGAVQFNDNLTVGTSSGDLFVSNASAIFNGKFSVGTPTELTIAAGAITVTKSFHTVDTEADAITDDLVTINGGSEGDFLIIRPADSTRTVVVRDAPGGNIQLAGDVSLDTTADILLLLFTANTWIELSRSNNA